MAEVPNSGPPGLADQLRSDETRPFLDVLSRSTSEGHKRVSSVRRPPFHTLPTPRQTVSQKQYIEERKASAQHVRSRRALMLVAK